MAASRTTAAVKRGQPRESSIRTSSSDDTGSGPCGGACCSRLAISGVYGAPVSACTSRAMPMTDMQSGRLGVM
jgi:hypothetical protein